MTKKGASDAEEWSNEVKAKPNEIRGPKLKPSPLKIKPKFYLKPAAGLILNLY